MKKNAFYIFIIFSAVLALLCACAEPGRQEIPSATEAPPVETLFTEPETVPPATEPLPEFGQTPEPSSTVLTVDGTALPEDSFKLGDVLYVRLDGLAQAVGAVYTEQIGTGAAHTCTAELFGHTMQFHTQSGYMLDDHTVICLGSEPIFDGEDWFLPAQELLRYFGFSVLDDPDGAAVYFTRYPKNDSIPEGKRVPVLMYHAVSDDCWGSTELFVSPSVLDAQIAALLENGYTLITFEDFDRLDSIEKPVMLTFDDGYDDNYDYLFPILQKYQVKATVFVIADDIGKNHKLTADEIREMDASGLVSIQSHTMSHNYLSTQNAEQLDYELSQSKLMLARLTGKEPFVLCYPTGMYSGLSLEVTAQYYQFGLLMSSGQYVTGQDPYLIHRYYVPRGLSADSLLRRIG